MTLDDLLNKVILILEHPEYKSVGAIVEVERTKNDINDENELRHIDLKGSKQSKDTIENANKARAKAFKRKPDKLLKYAKKLNSLRHSLENKKRENMKKFKEEEKIRASLMRDTL